jgi:hypothetical protein
MASTTATRVDSRAMPMELRSAEVNWLESKIER